MPIEKTMVFLKPEGSALLRPIRNRLSKFGRVNEDLSRTVSLTEGVLDVLYPNLTPGLRVCMHRHLLCVSTPLLVIEGENVIRQVLFDIGELDDPQACDLMSIRCLYAKYCKSENVVGEGIYYSNLIHCARNAVEAKVQIKALTDRNLFHHPLSHH